MNGYTKLFSSIVTSTIWREPKETKILWITMLALADKYGAVEGSIPGLADMARLTIPETQVALEVLHDPDEFSRTTDHEGRRVKTIDGGWQILNHGKYREKMNADERREYLRIKQQESRERKANMSKPVNNSQPPSTHVALPSTLSTHAECRVQSAEAIKEREKSGARPKGIEEVLKFIKTQPGYEEPIAREWHASRERQSWITGGDKPITNWQADLTSWILREARERKNGSRNGKPQAERKPGKWDNEF